MTLALRGLFLAAGIVGLSMASPAVARAWEITHPVYSPICEDASELAAQEFLGRSAPELRSLLDESGATAGSSNQEMNWQTYNLACVYQYTGDYRYAQQVVVLLERYAEVVPHWPLIARDGTTATPLAQVDYSAWDAGGLWGVWFHLDLIEGARLAKAYDAVASSGAIEARSMEVGRDVRQLIEFDLLRYMADLNLRFEQNVEIAGMPGEDFAYGNLGGHRMKGLIPFGMVVEPAYIHIVLRWLRLYPAVAHFRDGIWRESAPSYHRQIMGKLVAARDALFGYSDPPGYHFDGYITRFGKEFFGDGSRLDDLDPELNLEERFARTRSALDALVLPNGNYLAVHDSFWTQDSYTTRTESAPACLFSMRHCLFGRFTDQNQVQVHLHFGGTDGHEHYDGLNLTLWALGEELLSEGNYVSGDLWSRATAAHNTVVVDALDQQGRFADRFDLTIDDAVDHVGFYTYQDQGGGNSLNFGNLLLWDATHPNVMVVEAEAKNSYGVPLTYYRRTLIMVEIEGTDFYLVDVFRVRGGETHDWMLHGPLGDDYQFWTDLELSSTAEATRFGYLVPQEKTYVDTSWRSEFITSSGNHVRTTMLGATGTEVMLGLAPPMRTVDATPTDKMATFLDVRRTGGDSLFVAVHEPFVDAPRILHVVGLEYTDHADAPVILRIDMADGRSDLVAATLDTSPYPERQVSSENLLFRGRVVHVARQPDGVPQWMYLLDGGALHLEGITLDSATGDFGHRGEIQTVHRIENHGAYNGFETSTPLPTDGRLVGKTLLLILPDGRSEGYTIASVASVDGRFQIHVMEEPGIELRDGGALVKLVYYPWHGLRGAPIRFVIPGSAYRDALGNIEHTDPPAPPVCGDGIVDPAGETCDPPESCPADCDDGDPCTMDELVGAAASCDATCVHAPIADCAPGAGSSGCGCRAQGRASPLSVWLLWLLCWCALRRRAR